MSNINNIVYISVPVLYEIEFSNVPNQKPTIKQNVKYSTFVPIKTDTPFECKTNSSSWQNATMNTDKHDLLYYIQNTH